MIQSALYTLLSGNGGVSALAGTRIYPMVIPQQTYDEVTRQPCVVYSFAGRSRQVRFSGTDSLVAGSLQVDCYARTYAGAQDLAEAVRGCLVDYAGTVALATSPVTSVHIQKVFLDNEFDLMDIEPGLYRVSQTYSVWYDEA